MGGLLCALALQVCLRAQAEPEAARLPELPHLDTANFLPTVRAQIQSAAQEAQARPRNAQAVGSLAMTLHAYQQYDAAEQAYSRAHMLERGNFDWLYLLGAVQMERGELEAATRSFREALTIRPEDLAAALRFAQSLTSLAIWDEAVTRYRSILDGHPDCPQAWYGLGRVQAAKGDHPAAVQSLSKASDLFPAYGAAHFALAQELRRLGRKEEADKHRLLYSGNALTEPPLPDPLFQRIHELNQSTQVHFQRARELEQAGKLDEAIRETEAALQVDPGNVQAHVNLISLYGRTHQPDKAKQHFEEATRLNPGRSDAWYNFGILLLQERNFAEAEQVFRRALEINPSYPEAHNNLGVLYQQQGKLDDAAREFREAIAAQPDYPMARFNLGRILVNREQYDEAIRQFLRALEPEDEKTPVYLYALAATYARAGNREQALRYYERARDAAASHGQSQLLSSIERELGMLRNQQ